MLRAAVLTIALIAGALSAPAHADTAQRVVRDGLGAQLNEMLLEAAKNDFSGAVIVETKGVVILSAGYGYANREAQTPFTPDTIAQIGSITKPMTAIAVLQLVEQGKLDFQATAKTYLPGAAEPAASATLHRLLTHTAGLADTCGDDFERRTADDLIHRCMAMPLANPAGAYAYSNMGFSILAAIVEQVSGESWEDYLRTNVFLPLGMRSTGFTFPPSKPDAFATGYLNGQPQGVISDRIATLQGADWNLRGNGGVQASAADMHRLYLGLIGRAPGLSRSLVELMTKQHEQSEGEAFEGYGIAVRVDAAGKPYRIGHAGSDGTFLSYFGWYPQHDAFIYFVGSNGEPAVRPVLSKFLGALQKGIGIQPRTPAQPMQSPAPK